VDGTKLAGNAAQNADRTLPQIEELLAEAAAATADDARYGVAPGDLTPQTTAPRAERCSISRAGWQPRTRTAAIPRHREARRSAPGAADPEVHAAGADE
jgi:hypothetical protein